MTRKLSPEEKERRKLERKKQKEIEYLARTHKIINGIDHKICSKCNKYHPATLEYFYKNKSNSVDGLHPYCKRCVINESTEKIVANREEFNAYMRRRIAEREDVRLKMRETAREFRQTDKYKEWHENNKDKYAIYNQRRQHKNHDVSDLEWDKCKVYFNNECAYCGIREEEAKREYGQQFHKEHAIHNGADNLSNCIPSCKLCNSMKWEFELEDWYREQPFFNEEKLNKIHKWLNNDYKMYLDPYKIIKTKVEGTVKTYFYELWSVDDSGNKLDFIASGSKRKINKIIKNNFK